ncbi:MAG: VanZ family protein [Anaerolineae bacterium]
MMADSIEREDSAPQPGVRRLWLITAAIWIAGVVLLTTLPDRVSLIRQIEISLRHIWGGDLIGHTGLMGAFTGVVYAAARRGWRARFTLALAVAVLIPAFTSAITEWMQQFSPGRTPDRADFVANLLGVFIAATLICYAAAARRLRS